MRYALAWVVFVFAMFTPGTTWAADEPLICVETGEVGVLDIWSYDPPDPCVL